MLDLLPDSNTHALFCCLFYLVLNVISPPATQTTEQRKIPFLPESQSKELAEMLAQEDLGEMGLSSPSEQVAYLLVERATLLERLEAAESRLESQSLTGSLREGHHQVKD